ncbi:MAG: CvpA family protein [Planctomycetaceae bacterium]
MWYDLLVLGILLYFAVRGASRGIISQLAGIAGIVLCLVFAESISAAIGPMISLQPPLNHWVVMFGSYVFFSFIAFGFARVMNDWAANTGMETFNKHLGMVFGFAKGVVVCLVMTFFLVTLSPAARSALKMSKTGHISALIMDRLHPIMPEKLNVALHEYLNIHALDSHELDLQHNHSHDLGAGHPGTETTLGGAEPLPGSGTGTQAPPSWIDTNWPGTTQPPSTAPQVGSTPSIDQFLSQLPATIGSDVKLAIAQALNSTPPEQWPQAQAKIIEALSTTTPQQLKDRLIAGGRQSILNTLSGWADQYINQYLPQQPQQPTTTPQPPAAGSNNNSNFGWTTPTTPAYQPPTPYQPPQYQPPQPQPTLPLQITRREQLLVDISSAYSRIPSVQAQVQADISRRLAELPEEVSAAVLEDWRRDLFAPQTADPDPGTNAQATLESRILRQLNQRGIPTSRLSSQLQSQLEGASLR